MLIGILTDTHWSARKASRNLHDYFQLFYDNVFFPALEEHGVETVIHMGDAFDNRKSIDFWGLDWTKKVVLEPLRKYQVHMIVGNHDIFLRNSTEINAPELLLKDYPNIKTYSSPTNTKVCGIDMTFIPWICSENYDETLKVLKKSKAKVAMGHLELKGFRVNKHLVMEEHGLEANLFSNFTKVFSGHYHTRSDNGTVFYLGNPYEMYWTDVNDTRGFHIFDTETLEHTPINNPYKLFYNIYYEDTPHQTFDASEYSNKIVKVIVRKKSKQKDFEKFIDKLYKIGIQDLKIVENFEIQENENFVIEEEENTISILNRYIDESECDFDKSTIKGIFQDLYKQAAKWSKMFLLTLKGRKDDGAYAVQDQYGEKVLFLFEEEDDATRYAMMLEYDEDYEKEMEIVEVDDELAIKTCKNNNYKYAVITPDDIVIPPKNDNL